MERLGGEHLAGPSETGDNFIKDKQHVVPVANLPQHRQIFFGRIDDAASVADRFDHHRRNGLRAFQVNRVADQRGASDVLGWDQVDLGSFTVQNEYPQSLHRATIRILSTSSRTPTPRRRPD